jgi:subtilisin-like proprotein convertase family protein
LNTHYKFNPLTLAACISLALGMPLLASAQSHDVIGPQSNAKQPPPPVQAPGIRAVWLPPADALFDTGALADGTVAACSGDTGNASLLQAPVTTFGLNASLGGGFRIADDFTVPVGGSWTVQHGYIFSYQTGSTTTSTFTSVSARLWDGPPGGATSNIVCGDDTTNVMTATEFSGVYRLQETAPGCTRPVMVQTLDLSACPVLSAGTYWLDWQAAGSLASGPWAPPLAVLGVSSTGNAVQFNGTDWAPAVDATSGDTFGIPFVIAGTSGAGVPAITLDTAAATLTDQCVSAPGQSNGVIEPGETVQITVPVDAANGDFHNVVASLGPAPAGVTYVTSSAPLGTITAGNSATANFEIRMDIGAACLSSFTLPVNVASDEGSTSGSITADIGAPAGFPPGDVPLPIPDGNPTGATSTINVTQDLTLTDLTVHVDITHTWVGDLTITLTSPAGTAITLLDRPGYTGTGFGCNNNDVHVTFADGQADPETVCAGTDVAWPVTDAGPVTPLSALAGESTLGNWTLTVSDGAASDTGSLINWELTPTPAFTGTCSVCADSDIIFRDGFDTATP